MTTITTTAQRSTRALQCVNVALQETVKIFSVQIGNLTDRECLGSDMVQLILRSVDPVSQHSSGYTKKVYLN